MTSRIQENSTKRFFRFFIIYFWAAVATFITTKCIDDRPFDVVIFETITKPKVQDQVICHVNSCIFHHSELLTKWIGYDFILIRIYLFIFLSDVRCIQKFRLVCVVCINTSIKWHKTWNYLDLTFKKKKKTEKRKQCEIIRNCFITNFTWYMKADKLGSSYQCCIHRNTSVCLCISPSPSFRF